MRKRAKASEAPQPADPRIEYVRQARSERPREEFTECPMDTPPVAIDRDFCFSEDELA